MFVQINFLWLFDPFMKFRERDQSSIEESLTLDDINDMRQLNRILLSDYFNILQQNGSMSGSTYEQSVQQMILLND